MFMNTSDIKTYRLIIKGEVQGVGFRHWFSNLATSHGLNGYIKNLIKNDEVEVMVQGDTKPIFEIVEKSKSGPKYALVEEIITNEISTKVKYEEFITKYEN